ncbi:MFS transporter [Corticicoccus populi]|uniref:MFS transporter n=1 Tax=Corticicoccus populi TaxID=1812821 RepID=A0ABW5WVW2_9STAP
MANSNREILWTKDFIFTSVVNFVMMLSMYLLLVTMATYSMQEYNASISLAGFVASIFVIGSLIGRLYAGKKIAEMGNKKMLMTRIIAFFIVTIMYFLPLGLIGMMIIRLFHGIFLGMATTATGTIIAQVIPATRKGEGIGYFSMSIVLATAVGPLIGTFLVSGFGFTSIFIFSVVMAAVSLILSLFLNPPEITQPKEELKEKKGFSFSEYFEKHALPISAAMFVMAVAYSGILSFVTEYASSINLMQAGGFFFLVYGVSVLISRPVTGPLMDSKGANIVVYPSLVLFALGLLLISQASTGFIFLTAAVLLGLGYGNFQSIAQAIAIKLTPPHRMGLANSTYFIALDLGLGVGPLLLGYLVPATGYRGMYFSLVFLVIIGIVVYYFVHGRKDKEMA